MTCNLDSFSQLNPAQAKRPGVDSVKDAESLVSKSQVKRYPAPSVCVCVLSDSMSTVREEMCGRAESRNGVEGVPTSAHRTVTPARPPAPPQRNESSSPSPPSLSLEDSNRTLRCQ